MYDISQGIGIFEITEQCLSDQVGVIKINEWLSKVAM